MATVKTLELAGGIGVGLSAEWPRTDDYLQVTGKVVSADVESGRVVIEVTGADSDPYGPDDEDDE